MQTIELETTFKYRNLAYGICLYFTSFVTVLYLQRTFVFYIAITLILLSIIFAVVEISRNRLKSISWDSDKYYQLCIDNEKTDFWSIKRKIIINGWVYVVFEQESTKRKFKIWLHHSNFKIRDGIRVFARNILEKS